MPKLAETVVVLFLAASTAACSNQVTTPETAPPAPTARSVRSLPDHPEDVAGRPVRTGRGRVSIQPYALVPPACFPACPQIARERARGRDILIRRRATAINEVQLSENITPGNVYVYAMTPFDHPEHCRFVEDRFLGIPYPCRSNGPLDRLDGLDPATGFYVGTYGGKVAEQDRISFRIDVVHDTPTEVIFGSPVTNPAGMMFYAGVMEKGPVLPEGHPLRRAQLNTLLGGCQGPPAFGPLPCRWVHVAAHAPR